MIWQRLQQLRQRLQDFFFQVSRRCQTNGNQQDNPQAFDFSTAQSFRELFKLLDEKGTLWGSQKRYTAVELKTLINRCRSDRTAQRFRTQLIPRTAGLRQKVEDLCAAERSQGTDYSATSAESKQQ